MTYSSFYRFIKKENDKYRIMYNGEDYGTYENLAEALYDRDRLINVGWDWDKFCEMEETINGYIHIQLPPFAHESSYITIDSECWVVRNKGKDQKYRGTYYSEEEAKKVAMIYDANIAHKKKRYRVQRRINGKTKYFGRYKTYEEAQRRVEELEECDWSV